MSSSALLPRPSARQWAAICAVSLPLLGLVWKTTQVAASASVKETIATELRPIIVRMDAQADDTKKEITSIRKDLIGIPRYDRDTLDNTNAHKEIAARQALDYKEIVQILRGIEAKQADRDQKIMQTLGRLEGFQQMGE